MSHFNNLGLEERQRLINVQQRHEGLREVGRVLKSRYAGTMIWRDRDGQDYLYRRARNIEKSLGARNGQTEQAYEAFQVGRKRAQERQQELRAGLEAMAGANRAAGLARVPAQVARILRNLDQAGVLGDQVCVVGTNALFAYEAISGVQFGSGLLATEDLDIALDARKSLTLAARMVPEGLLGLLKRADRTFERLGNAFSAQNSAGLLVDLITASPRNRHHQTSPHKRRLGDVPGDLEAVEIPRLEMIVDAPRVTTTAIDERGLPVSIAAADPRWWASHKFWLAELEDRSPLKQVRDEEQAIAVCQMLATNWTDVDLSDTALASIPKHYRKRVTDEIEAARSQGANVEW